MLDINRNSKIRKDILDMDYLHKLSDEEFEWFAQFMNEYVSGNFVKDEKGEYSKKNLHKTAKERKDCYDRNNARNRDGLTASNAFKKTVEFKDELVDDFLDPFLEAENQAIILDCIMTKSSKQKRKRQKRKV